MRNTPPIDDAIRFLGLVVIALNAPLSLFVLAMTIQSLGARGELFTIPLLVAPLLNVTAVFRLRRDPQANISRCWIVFCNTLMGLYGVLFLIPGKGFQPVLASIFIATSLISILVLILAHSLALKKQADRPIPQNQSAEGVLVRIISTLKVTAGSIPFMEPR